MAKYTMVIDTKKCFGCQTCAIACKVSNNLPKNTLWNRIITTGSDNFDCGGGTYPNVDMKFMPVACQHCEDPACVGACPTGASVQNDDGVVTVNPEACIGCKSCMNACPYGARVLNESEPEYYLDFEVGDGYEPEHIGNTVEKCNFCQQRTGVGLVPACMECCPGRARFWGDLGDPDSDVAKIVTGRERMDFLTEEGTGPTTIYLA